MAKRKKLEVSVPSKAYLVSFGDTMTALLAFFIVMNSLAKEQTGAAMHSGTGSFVRSFANSGMPGDKPGQNSRDMVQQTAQKPIYALKENLSKNDGNVGPDDSDENDRIQDRDKEQFQKFLSRLDKEFNLEKLPSQKNQVAFDSFAAPNRETGGLSKHALQLISESLIKLRQSDAMVEVILWADMPSKGSLQRHLEQSHAVRREVESKFWLEGDAQKKIRYRVKPWLFSDAKRPVITVVCSELQSSAAPSN